MSNFLYLVAEIWMWLGIVWIYEHRELQNTLDDDDKH